MIIPEMTFKIVGSRHGVLVPNNRIVKLFDGEEFSLKFYNPMPTRVQIELFVNGKVNNKKAFAGLWIIDPFKNAEVERGTVSQSKFTFKGISSGINLSELTTTDKEDWGLVSVRFRNEYVEDNVSEEAPCTLGGGGFVGRTSFNKNISGAIVGGAHSNQTFGTTHKITEFGELDTIYALRIQEAEKFSRISASAPEYIYP